VGDFWRPVSAAKNSVPGGAGFVRQKRAILGFENWGSGKAKNAGFESQLLRVQSERLELQAPFRRSIPKSFDSNAARQAAFNRRSHEIRCASRWWSSSPTFRRLAVTTLRHTDGIGWTCGLIEAAPARLELFRQHSLHDLIAIDENM